MEKVRDKLCGYIGEIDDYLFYDKKAMDKAIAYDEGVADGISQGISQGIEQNKLDVTHKLLLKNFSIKEIAEITNLPIEEIEKIKNKLNNNIEE